MIAVTSTVPCMRVWEQVLVVWSVQHNAYRIQLKIPGDQGWSWSNLLHIGSILTTYWQKLVEFLVNETMVYACVCTRASDAGCKVFLLFYLDAVHWFTIVLHWRTMNARTGYTWSGNSGENARVELKGWPMVIARMGRCFHVLISFFFLYNYLTAHKCTPWICAGTLYVVKSGPKRPELVRQVRMRRF